LLLLYLILIAYIISHTFIFYDLINRLINFNIINSFFVIVYSKINHFRYIKFINGSGKIKEIKECINNELKIKLKSIKISLICFDKFQIVQ
jgi:hypothetical protein